MSVFLKMYLTYVTVYNSVIFLQNKISGRGRKRRKLATHNKPTSTKKQIKKRNSQVRNSLFTSIN